MQCKTYVVWQKSNETEFLLTMNFILFTNQGYTLQNSSLGSYTATEALFPFFVARAGSLLLVYLSARRLRSSGYYPKYQNGALSSGFWAEGIQRSHRDWDPANRVAEEPQECFFVPKIHWWRLPCDMGRCRVAASKCVQCLVAHVPPFSWVFQGLTDKMLDWQFVLVAQIPCGHSPNCQKTNEHWLVLDLLILAFLGRGEYAVCHSRLWRFVSGSYSKIHDSSPVITRLKNSGSLSRRSKRSRHTSLRLAFCSVVRFFGTILAHNFLVFRSCVKIWWTVSRFKFLTTDHFQRQSTIWPHKRPHSFHIVVRVEVEALPARGSSSTCFRFSKKDLCHLNTCALDRECSP